MSDERIFVTEKYGLR